MGGPPSAPPVTLTPHAPLWLRLRSILLLLIGTSRIQLMAQGAVGNGLMGFKVFSNPVHSMMGLGEGAAGTAGPHCSSCT